jgi:Lrp/AsnC family leucine-responsive transcriptional regulator
MDLDDIDRRILAVLQREGRISNQDLADRVGLSPSPCLRRVRLLETAGVIARYAALLDSAALGYGVEAWVEVRLDRQTTASTALFEAEIPKYPQIQECFQLAGEWDYALRIVARDLEDFRQLCVNTLSGISGVGNVKSNIVMKRVKFTTELPIQGAR